MGLRNLRPVVQVRHFGFHERWGRAVLETAVAQRVAKQSNALALFETLTNPGAVSLVALSLQSTSPKLYTHLGHLAESKGVHAASQYVDEVLAKYIPNETPSATHLANDTHERGATYAPPMPGPPVHVLDSNKSTEGRVNIETRGPFGEMDLFDSETWLTESPTGQRLWKEAHE